MEFGSYLDPKFILIDGGPAQIFERYLKDELWKIREQGGILDLVIVSHVDNDHIKGVIDLFTELKKQSDNNKHNILKIRSLWHNAFSKIIQEDNNIEVNMNELQLPVSNSSGNLTKSGTMLEGIAEGDQLSKIAAAVNIPINLEFKNGLITVENALKAINIENLKLQIIGPTKKNLEELRKKWYDWFAEYRTAISLQDPFLLETSDRSIPNLSSIMFLAEADGKRILFTGDGLADDIIDGINQADLLDDMGHLYVDILKIPHHGSNQNVSEKLFMTVIAETYVISANGRDGNPDLDILILIVEAAKKQNGNIIEIIVTNETQSTQELRKQYDSKKYKYQLTVMEKGSPSKVLKIVS